jgi:hypothetical protein
MLWRNILRLGYALVLLVAHSLVFLSLADNHSLLSGDDQVFIQGLPLAELRHLARLCGIPARDTRDAYAGAGGVDMNDADSLAKALLDARNHVAWLKEAVAELRWGHARYSAEELGRDTAPQSSSQQHSAAAAHPEPFMKQLSGTLLAVNFIDQSRMYFHHAVFDRMPAKPRLVPTDMYVTEFSGLLVPREFDCDNLDVGGGELCGHPYASSVPSRWFLCGELRMRKFSGLKHFIPSLPVVDEEYFEAVAIYDKALSAKDYFAVAEFGARWGTWGLRSVAALREYNSNWPMPYSLYFAEPCRQGCDAISHTAALNGINNYTTLCDYANIQSFQEWSEGQPWIDVADFDIQGAEFDLIPHIMPILNKKVKRVILSLHSADTTKHTHSLRQLFHRWTLHMEMPLNVVDGEAAPCIGDILRRGMHWHDQEVLQKVRVCRASAFDTAFGPVMQFDGEWIMDNPAFGGA